MVASHATSSSQVPDVPGIFKVREAYLDNSVESARTRTASSRLSQPFVPSIQAVFERQASTASRNEFRLLSKAPRMGI